MRKFFFIAFYSLYATALISQVSSPKDTLAAHQLVLESIDLTEKREYQEAKQRLWRAADLLKKANALEINTYGKVLQQQGLIFIKTRQADSALHVIPKALALRTKLYGLNIKPNAISLLNIGQAYQLKLNFSKALEYEQKALDVFNVLPGDNQLSIADAYNNMGNTYAQQGKLPKAIEVGSKALEIRKTALPIDSADLAYSYNNMGIYYQMSGQMQQAVEYLEKCLLIRQLIYTDDHPVLGASYSNLGAALHFTGNNARALELLETSLTLRNAYLDPNDLELGESYTNICLPLNALGDYERAIACAEQAIRILGKNGMLGVAQMGQPYLSLGNALLYKGQYDEAMASFEKAATYFTLIGNSALVAKALNNISVVYEQKGDYEGQKKYMLKAFNKQNSLSENHPERIRSFINLGLIHVHTNQADSALLFLNEAENLLQKNNVKSPGVPTLYNARALAQIQLGLWEEALATLEQAKQANQYKQSGKFEQVTHMDNLLVSLAAVGNIWRNRSDSLQHPEHLEKARAAFLETADAANSLRNSPLDPISKAAINERIHKLYDAIIETNWALYAKTNKAQYRSEAFQFSEASKSFNLYLAVQSSGVQQFSNVPPAVLEQERQLQAAIRSLKSQTGAIDNSPAQQDSLARALLSQKEAYQALLLSIKNNSPEYYNLKYSYTGEKPQQVQALLGKDQTLLEFFWGTEAVYVFALQHDTTAWEKIPYGPDFVPDALLAQLQYGLTNYFETKSVSPVHWEQTASAYANAAFTIYQKIITPVAGLLTDKVIIVPDGPLGYVPFDILLETKPEYPTRFHIHNYFGNEKKISYAYSAALLRKMQEKQYPSPRRRSLLALAPFAFPDISATAQPGKESTEFLTALRDTLPMLQFSGKEAKAAARIFNGQVEIGSKASKILFQKTAEAYRIIHLGTHAKANQKVGTRAYIAFSIEGNPTQFEKLFVREIYKLALQADLVVLSACETGTGQFQRGEGIISLARAFAYAGAKSIVPTLWSVDDTRAAQLMEYFYTNLAEANTGKDEALWKAKCDYIAANKHGKSAHPYFWAGYIPIGDMSKL